MLDRQRVQGLVIGANGLIGQYLGRLLSQKNINWMGTYCKRLNENSIKVNILNDHDLELSFSSIDPTVVFLCANLSGGVDFCEKNIDQATEFHLNSTKKIGQYCKVKNATLVYFSTDYIFDGQEGPYREDARPNPLNVYGKLKLQAEHWIAENLKKYLIIRTTNVYGWDLKTVTPNYMMSLYRDLSKGKMFFAPSFLYGNPTYVEDLVQGILELYEKNYSGLFHIVGDSFIDRFQWALSAANILNLNPALIEKLEQPEKSHVVRPLKSWLSNQKFKQHCHTTMHDYVEGLSLMKKQINKYF